MLAACSFTALSAGMRMAINIAMIAMTTSNSISVKPFLFISLPFLSAKTPVKGTEVQDRMEPKLAVFSLPCNTTEHYCR
jgi:hypothetical protein